MSTRITGLVSGLDVDSLVTAGTSLYKSKLDKANQAEKIAEWKQEQYRKIESDTTKFYNKYLDTTSSKCLANPAMWNTTKYTSNNESAVTVTASPEATAKMDNYTIKVSQLAKAATTTLALTDCSNGLSITGGTSATAKTLSTAEINTAITGKTTEQEKLTAIASALNTKLSDSGMTATYSEFSGGIVLKTDALGKDSTIKVMNVDETATIKDVKGDNLNATIINSSGTYTISDLTNPTNKNSVTLDGITFNFKDTTTTDAKVTGSNDVSDLQDTIESFVDDYNTLIKSINSKIYETYDKDYLPLTDTEKESMSETQIATWEKKAQVGLLHNDSYLQQLASDMKDTMTTLMSGSGISLESIGIKPVFNFTTKNGTFDVNSDKLKSALEGTITINKKNITADDVKSLFMKNVNLTTSYSKSVDNSSGLLAKLRVALNKNVCGSDSELTKRAGNEEYASSLTTNELFLFLKTQTRLIATLEDSLEDKQDALYKKYSTLETNLSSLQASSGVFSSKSSS